MESGDIKFIRAQRIETYLADYFESLEEPFTPSSPFIRSMLTDVGRKFSFALEKLVGGEVYIKKQSSGLELLPAKFHRLTEKLISDGIISNFYVAKPIPDWPKLPAFVFNITKNIVTSAAGYALDYNDAAVKAIAECIERYSLTIYDPQKFIAGSWKELRGRKALDPRKFRGFSDSQLRQQEYSSYCFDENVKFLWTEAVSLSSGKNYLIPAQLVYLNFHSLIEEPRIRQNIGSGAAAGSFWEMAVYNAVCEAIERDAFMIHWLNKISPPRIDLENAPTESVRRLIGKYKKYHVDFEVLDITTDIEVPTVVTVVRDVSPGRPVVYVSPRADLDIALALEASLCDGLRVGFGPKNSFEEIKKISKRASDIRGLKDRRLYWCDPSHRKEAEFLFAGPRKKIPETNYIGAGVDVKLRRLKEVLSAHNLDVYIADVTTPLAKEAGLTVVMSLLPDLYPLYLNEHYKYLGVKRLYEAPVHMGVFAKSKTEEEMNLIPHPML